MPTESEVDAAEKVLESCSNSFITNRTAAEKTLEAAENVRAEATTKREENTFTSTSNTLEYTGRIEPDKEVDYNGIKYIREDVIAKREQKLREALEAYQSIVPALRDVPPTVAGELSKAYEGAKQILLQTEEKPDA